MFKGRLIPAPVMRAILSGLLNSSWGRFHRSTIVRLTVYGNYVEIGIGEGNIYQWELDALKGASIKHEWVAVRVLEIAQVEGIKYIPEKEVSGMPRGLLPTRSRSIYIFISNDLKMVFPAYRCFDINFGERRILSIISPRSLIRDSAEAVHPAFPKEKYHGRVNSVEVAADALSKFFRDGYGIGILRKRGAMKGGVKAFPLLGEEDIKVILESLSEHHPQ
ncbi:MAG: hypothetical protein QXH97_03795 [Candidatus Bathyarchaeia archaeon]